MIDAAHAVGGGESASTGTLGAIYQRHMNTQTECGSQDTWAAGAIGAGTYMSFYAVGNSNWAEEMGAVYLGSRQDYHAEMAIVSDRPGVRAVFATQDCCIFCYGYLALYNYQHQGLRDDPWPKTGWKHPHGLFKLIAGAAALGPLVTISYGGENRTYQVKQY